MTLRLSSLLTGLALLAPPAAAATPLLPDLVGKGPTEHSLEHDLAGGRLLLRFNGYVHNQGQGAFELRASNPTGGVMSTVRQRLFEPDGVTFTDVDSDADVAYETNDQHEHFHFKQATAYSLWTLDHSAQVAPSPKVGFCLEDGDHLDAHGPQSAVYKVGAHPDYDYCGNGEPTQSEVLMGISPGWEDVYGWELAFQWVDVSNVAPGRYLLAADTDPGAVITESDEVNPVAFAADESVVPGWLAQPVDAGTIPSGRDTGIQLDAHSYGTPGAVEFKITDPPDHGTLDRPADQWFSGPGVVYTPAPGYSGPDSFRFTARDGTSTFPTSPPQAAVGLSVGAPSSSVLISGAPEQLEAGRGVQLTASVTGDSPGVTWSTDAGTISANGFYTAPSTAPASGVAHVRATSASGTYDEVAIRILAPAESEAAPSVPGNTATRRSNPLTIPTLARHGDLLLVRVRAARAGRLRVTARRGRHRLGGCFARVEAHRALLCRIELRRTGAAASRYYCPVPRTARLGLPRLRVTVTLRVGRRLVAIRRREL